MHSCTKFRQAMGASFGQSATSISPTVVFKTTLPEVAGCSTVDMMMFAAWSAALWTRRLSFYRCKHRHAAAAVRTLSSQAVVMSSMRCADINSLQTHTLFITWIRTLDLLVDYIECGVNFCYFYDILFWRVQRACECYLRGGPPCESLILHLGIIWRGTEKKTVARSLNHAS